MAALGVWFWFVGIYRLPATPGTGNYAFFFAKFAISGSIFTFFKILATVNLLIWWHAFCGSLLERIYYLKCEKDWNNGSGEKKGLLKVLYQVVVELSLPSHERFKTVPADVNFFRQYVRLLFNPDPEKMFDEIQSYLVGFAPDGSVLAVTSGNPTDPLANASMLVYDYIQYTICSRTANTLAHIEKNKDRVPLTDEQKNAIRDFNDLLEKHKRILISPVGLGPIPRILLHLLGIGPSLIRMVGNWHKEVTTSRVSPGMVNSFPRMVALSRQMVEPQLPGYLGGNRIIEPLEVSFGAFSIRAEPFHVPIIVFNTSKLAKDSDRQEKTASLGSPQHDQVAKKPTNSKPLWRKMLKLWS